MTQHTQKNALFHKIAALIFLVSAANINCAVEHFESAYQKGQKRFSDSKDIIKNAAKNGLENFKNNNFFETNNNLRTLINRIRLAKITLPYLFNRVVSNEQKRWASDLYNQWKNEIVLAFFALSPVLNLDTENLSSDEKKRDVIKDLINLINQLKTLKNEFDQLNPQIRNRVSESNQ